MLLAGSSAGGPGTLFNFDAVAQTFDEWVAGILAGSPTDVDPGTARVVAAR